MYREAELPYGPLARRPGWPWRALGFLVGALTALLGAGLFVFVVKICLDTNLRGADWLVPAALPILAGMAAYGVDFARRAVLVRSTDRSAFEGQVGRRRALLGLIFSSYIALWTTATYLAVMPLESLPLRVFMWIMMVGGFSLAGFSLRGLRRVRVVAPPAFVAEPPAMRVAPLPLEEDDEPESPARAERAR